MILEEYNEELHIKNEKEISFEEGKAETMLRVYKNCLNRGMTREEAIAISGITEEVLAKVQ